ncbi:uncharacterized protein DDB_G0290301-like isoform X2 [Pseudomyrmex gracilis]|nr:uncharacterized protein DDB_G0290301-like isoform X2 [Pseudomyrmex gracilis]XP_020284379.1 uncharacterized protein DDB_G0290301-like isoform X2 [Pseudomyrmex gracilis]XP_020284380.1 uncharacterized protein DDB_G0290301-like isoform X2 [Pseudomyrmex gracilis]
MKHPEAKTANMQSEGEIKSVSIQKEGAKEENGNKAVALEDKKHVDQISSELQSSPKIVQEVISAENKATQEKEEVSLENSNIETKESQQEEQDEDIKLTLETESVTENGDNKSTDNKQPQDDQKTTGTAAQEELKNGINDKEEIQSEVPTDTESYSVDIVESTTSEVSETSESVSQSDLQKDKEKDDTVNNDDASFITYNSSIMLKDVQIRLNDCLKDNSKLFEVSNTEDTPSLQSKDLSFGKTLRNISGRHSINRMRHVTLRERRISPNSSLFVNTSTMSIAHDEGAESKVLHYNSDVLSKTFPTNGSPLERKRKIETAEWESSKKPKTANESGLLNTSLGFLKGFSRMQVSTPKATNPYKFTSTRLNISGIRDDDDTIKAESTESTKKWCVIM